MNFPTTKCGDRQTQTKPSENLNNGQPRRRTVPVMVGNTWLGDALASLVVAVIIEHCDVLTQLRVHTIFHHVPTPDPVETLLHWQYPFLQPTEFSKIHLCSGLQPTLFHLIVHLSPPQFLLHSHPPFEEHRPVERSSAQMKPLHFSIFSWSKSRFMSQLFPVQPFLHWHFKTLPYILVRIHLLVFCILQSCFPHLSQFRPLHWYLQTHR